jgi:hypothetical protein
MNEYQFYMDTNVDKYIGEWISIVNKEIVAHGKDVKKVFSETKSKYPKIRPFITKVPEEHAMIF